MNKLTISNNGIRRYWKNNLLHRLNGPAIIYPSFVYNNIITHDYKYWYYNGEFIDDIYNQEEFKKYIKLMVLM